MKIKTIDLWRRYKKITEIEDKLLPITVQSFNQNTVDDISEKKINLRVKFAERGEGLYYTIPTYIILKEKNKGTRIICKNEITKPILISLCFGLLCPFPAIIEQAWFTYALLAFIISAIAFFIFLNRITQTTRELLIKLKV